MNTNRFAVLSYGEPLTDDGAMIPEVVARFSTYEAAETFRAQRYGEWDEFSAVAED